MFGRYILLCVSLYQTKQLNIKIMTFTTKENGKVELRRVYDEGEKFYGKVLVRFNDMKSPLRITLEQWEEIIVSWGKEQIKQKNN